MRDLDAKMTAWGERTIAGIKEAYPMPAAPPADPPAEPPAAPPKAGEQPPKQKPKPDDKPDEPVPGKRRTFAEWWFTG
jgi:hypothetical protein